MSITQQLSLDYSTLFLHCCCVFFFFIPFVVSLSLSLFSIPMVAFILVFRFNVSFFSYFFFCWVFCWQRDDISIQLEINEAFFVHSLVTLFKLCFLSCLCVCVCAFFIYRPRPFQTIVFAQLAAVNWKLQFKVISFSAFSYDMEKLCFHWHRMKKK